MENVPKDIEKQILMNHSKILCNVIMSILITFLREILTSIIVITSLLETAVNIKSICIFFLKSNLPEYITFIQAFTNLHGERRHIYIYIYIYIYIFR